MKAARFYMPHEPLRLEQVPVPEIGPDDVLLDVKATGICGSDIHILEGVTPTGFTPITLGHEIAGVVAEAGANVVGWKPGDRACVDCITFCGSCYNCLRGRESICVSRKLLGIHLDGGLAEYVRVPARNLIHLPENIPFEHGAIITDAVAIPYHALTKRANFQLGQTLAVFGVGGLGYHAVQLGRLAGAAKVIAVDVISRNLERARVVGADVVIDSFKDDPVKVIKDITAGEGVDVALECIGLKRTIQQCIESVRVGGKAVLIGLGPDPIETLPPTIFVRSEIEIIASYFFERGEIQQLVELAANGRLNLSGSVTKRLPLEKVNTALEHLEKKVGNPIRIVITQD
jgi:propanol-preferring alcohol dehydrogenase